MYGNSWCNIECLGFHIKPGALRLFLLNSCHSLISRLKSWTSLYISISCYLKKSARSHGIMFMFTSG